MDGVPPGEYPLIDSASSKGISLMFFTPSAFAAAFRSTRLSPGTTRRAYSPSFVLETRFFVILWRSIPVALEASAVWTVSFFSMNLCQIPRFLRYFSRSVGLVLP